MIKHPHVPSKLFKHRDFTPNHLDALERDQLWFSSPDRFNDPYDTVIYFDPDRLPVPDINATELISQAKNPPNDITDAHPWNDWEGNTLQSGDWLLRELTEQFADMPEDGRAALIDLARTLRMASNERSIKQMNDFFRSGFEVLSLSERCTSILMWSHYSANHTGFCIEYDFGRLDYGDIRKRLCFPVFYRKKLTDATRYISKRPGKGFNNLFGQLICLLKNAEWSYEKEWRIIHAIGPDHTNRLMDMPPPSALIVGANVSADNLEIAKNFCRARQIPLRKAVQSISSFEISIVDVDLEAN